MKPRTWLSLAAVVAVALIALPEASGQPQPTTPDPEVARIIRGFGIAPVPLKLRGRDRALVGLGSYIVNAQGGCNDCHTNPSYAAGGDPFMGEPEQINTASYLAGGVNFGPFTSRNITPNDEGLPAGLTWPEFKRVLRTGFDHDQEHPEISPLLQVMPWPVYRHMTDRDLRAVYEYLRSIPTAGVHDD